MFTRTQAVLAASALLLGGTVVATQALPEDDGLLTLAEVRVELVRSRGFIRAADTQLTKSLALVDSLIAQGDNEPTPDNPYPVEPSDSTFILLPDSTRLFDGDTLQLAVGDTIQLCAVLQYGDGTYEVDPFSIDCQQRLTDYIRNKSGNPDTLPQWKPQVTEPTPIGPAGDPAIIQPAA